MKSSVLDNSEKKTLKKKKKHQKVVVNDDRRMESTSKKRKNSSNDNESYSKKKKKKKDLKDEASSIESKTASDLKDDSSSSCGQSELVATSYTPGSIANMLSAGKKNIQLDDGMAALFSKKFPTQKKRVVSGEVSKNNASSSDTKKPVSETSTENSQSKDGQKQKKSSAKERIIPSHPAVRRLQKKRDPETAERTLFCGNLPLTTNRKALQKLFSKFGKIESVRVRSVVSANPKISAKAAFIRKEFHEGKNNVNAYIVFEQKESAEKALEMNGVELGKMRIRVDWSLPTKTHDDKKCIFVGSLPFDAEEDKLREHFAECGTVDNVRLIRDKKTGIGKGIGYVSFQSVDSVGLALKMNETKFMKRKIRVTRAIAAGSKSKFREARRKEKKLSKKRPNTSQETRQKSTKGKFSGKKKPFSAALLESDHYQGTKAVAFHKIKQKKKAVKRLKLKKKKTDAGQIVRKHSKSTAGKKTTHKATKGKKQKKYLGKKGHAKNRQSDKQ